MKKDDPSIRLIGWVLSLVTTAVFIKGEDKCTEVAYKARIASCCPNGWFDLHKVKKCIKYAGAPDDNMMTWPDARKVCQDKYQGELLRAENVYIAIDAIENNKRRDTMRYYWIGMRKNDSIKPIWLDDEEHATWFNWKKGPPYEIPLADEGCVMMHQVTGIWELKDCNTTAWYICEQPNGRFHERPKLDFINNFDSKTAYINETLLFRCTQHSDYKTKLHFVATYLNGKSYKLTSSRSDVTEYVTYVNPDCHIKRELIWKFRVSREFKRLNYKCCSADEHGIEDCVTTRNPTVAYLSKVPILTINDQIYELGTDVTASCSGYVGTGGVLIWNLTASHGNIIWKIVGEKDIRVQEEGDTEWELITNDYYYGIKVIAKPVEYDNDYGPKFESTIYMQMMPMISGGKISCQTYIEADPKVNAGKTVYSLNFRASERSSLEYVTASAFNWIPLVSVIMVIGTAILLVYVAYPEILERKGKKTHGRNSLKRKSQTKALASDHVGDASDHVGEMPKSETTDYKED